jgi:phospholipase D
MKVAIALLLAIAGASPALCAEFPTRMHPVDADVSVCFTPGENCQSEIVQAINGAEKQIRVQAYGFTSLPILQALQQAISRGVDVELALDKSDAFGKDKQPKLDGPAASMVAAGAKVWIDDHPGP